MNEGLAILPLPVDPARLTRGADLAALLFQPDCPVRGGDVVVVSAWAVAAVEDRARLVDRADAASYDNLVEQEAATVLRRRGAWRLIETEQGIIAGQDEVIRRPDDEGRCLLLPLDADRSARRLRDAARHRFRLDIAVVVEAGLGRPWRRGLVGTALGSAGLRPLTPSSSLEGSNSAQRCVADEVAAAAALTLQLGEAAATIGAIVRGLPASLLGSGGGAASVLRPLRRQLFR